MGGTKKSSGFNVFLVILGVAFLVGGLFAYVNRGSLQSLVHLSSDVLNVPGKPQNVAASPGDTNITVYWDAPSSDGGSLITGFAIFTNGTLAAVTNGTATTITITGLTNGNQYLVRVAAINDVGIGDNATEITVSPWS